MATEKQKNYITRWIIKALENDLIPWQQTWIDDSSHHNGFKGNAYTGSNRLILWAFSALHGLSSSVWLTPKQIRQLGGHINKGAKVCDILFYKAQEIEELDPDTNELVTRKGKSLLIFSRVFNLEHTTGVKLPKRELVKPKRAKKLNPKKKAQAILDNFLAGADAPSYDHNGGGSAFYRPSTHAISMPKQELFNSYDAYIATSYHECGHATGNSSMLNRFDNETKLAPFGSEDYSKEELIAEFTSAFLCHEAGINSTRKNSASYIKSWLKVLKNDSGMLLDAAGQAQKASNFILKAPTGAVEAPVG